MILRPPRSTQGRSSAASDVYKRQYLNNGLYKGTVKAPLVPSVYAAYKMDKLAIFNFMIGNYDWGIPGEHNVKIFRPGTFSANNKPIAIPYDFDWTGIVNPSYGIPADNVGITNIRQRIFAGICRSREVYTRDLEEFSRKKEELYRVINEFPYLSQSSKKDMIAYIEGFYDLFQGRNNIVDIFLRNCKKL